MNNKLKLLPSIWAIYPDELRKIETLYAEYIEKEIKQECLNSDLFKSDESENIQIIDNVGILKIEGVIVAKGDFWTWLFGGAPLDQLTDDFKSLLNNDQVDTIILDIDSPGGTVEGVATFANMVFEARDQKRILAYSSSLMASAAMWIGAAAEKILISDNTVTTGSIGVLVTHFEISEFQKRVGIKTTEITAGKFKRIASSFAPLSEEGRAYLQSQVDHLMDVFVNDVARFKGVSNEDVRLNMADGKVFIGNKGVEAGLVDEIINFDLLMGTLNSGGRNMSIFAKNVEASLDNLKVHHADIYDQAVAIGASKAIDEFEKKIEAAEKSSFEAGRIAGAKAERERINGIDACTIAGQEKLASELKADGSITPGEAAIKMINADKQAKASGLKRIEDEAPKAIGPEVSNTVITNARTAKQEWEASADLQKEFPDVAVYESYVKNCKDGNVRVYRQAVSK